MGPESVWRRVEAVAERAPRAIQAKRRWGRRLRPASVLVPFYRVADVPYLLFTKRSEALPSHKGEISFPGGSQEPHDPDLVRTALRETHEELGIEPGAVRVIGPVDDVWSIAGYRVTPYVAEIPPPPVPRVNVAEVAEVIEVDVLRLMDDKIHRQTRLSRLGEVFRIHYYDYGAHTIWGMTGRIVHDLLTWLKAPGRTTDAADDR